MSRLPSNMAARPQPGPARGRRMLRGRAGEVFRVLLAAVIALALIGSGTVRLPGVEPPRVASAATPFRHPPVMVYSEPVLRPLVVSAERVLPHHIFPALPNLHRAFERARVGEQVHVSLTQYCLQGTTRRDHWVREGIVAADPRVFPLAHYVEVTMGKHFLGRFLVDDTGGKVKGAHLDIWTPSCSDARRFGRRRGTATLVVKPEN